MVEGHSYDMSVLILIVSVFSRHAMKYKETGIAPENDKIFDEIVSYVDMRNTPDIPGRNAHLFSFSIKQAVQSAAYFAFENTTPRESIREGEMALELVEFLNRKLPGVFGDA
jgi:hypothetical protein